MTAEGDEDMSVLRQYQITANDGAELIAAFDALDKVLKTIAGFEGLELLRDVDQADRFVLHERWASPAAHAAAGAQMPPEAGARVRAAMASIASGCYLEQVLSR